MNDEMHTPDIEDVFSADSMESIAVMTRMIVTQQRIAVDLTKLVLEHCIESKITKEEVFEIYEEASALLRSEID